MEEYIAKAKHNETFHCDLCETFQDKYFDWRITSLFYTAIHWIKVLANKEKKEIGVTHKEVNQNIDPNNSSAKLRISKGAYHYYINLYKHSKTARYDGIDTDPETFERLKESDWKECKKHFEGLKKYLKDKRGLDL